MKSNHTVTTDDQFADLVTNLYAARLVLMASDGCQHLCRHTMDATIDRVFNHFRHVRPLTLTIRDLSAHNAYPVHSIRLQFTDGQALKSRPTATQLKKLHYDLIASFTPHLYATTTGGDPDDCLTPTVDGVPIGGQSTPTPWFDRWKRMFIETFEMSEHDFLGAQFGSFFVITDQELDAFKDIFATFVTQIKQMSWIRWLQPDFLRYYVVISEQSLDTHLSMNTPKAALFRELQSIYPNSYWLQMDGQSPQQNDGLDSEPTDSVFSDSSQRPVVRCESTDSCDRTVEMGGDPLMATITGGGGAKQHNNTSNTSRMSSGSSDQSITKSLHSLSLNDLCQQYLQAARQSPNHTPPPKYAALQSAMDTMLREFVAKTLIPWAEKHIKLLADSIAQRKGFRRSIFTATKSLLNNMSTSTVSLRSSTGAGGQSAVVYMPEAPEMQLRKLGDLCMSMTAYELAYQSYYAAKKDYQSEQAWLHYAAASESAAVASYFTPRFQRHYFDQSVTCYVDTCRAMSLATRSTILATEAIRHLWPNEAANLFIRMTGDDSDLRSALFLEQASLCFLKAGARARKSAFHYVLAGHRFNRCGLKHYALASYQRFASSQWSSAADHVNLTIARLCLTIAATNKPVVNGYDDYRRRGLELLRSNASKVLFFQEFVREVKRDLDSTTTPTGDQTDAANSYHYLDIPFVQTIELIDGSIPTVVAAKGQPISDRLVCFVGEELIYRLTLRSPFSYVLHRLCFYTNTTTGAAAATGAPDLICPAITATLDANGTGGNEEDDDSERQSIVQLYIVPQTECSFDILGLEYRCDDMVPIKCPFGDRLAARLRFKAVKSLPLIHMNIRPTAATIETNGSLSVFSTELIDLSIRLSTSVTAAQWMPSSLRLTTNAVVIDSFNNIVIGRVVGSVTETDIPIVLNTDNAVRIQLPVMMASGGQQQRYETYFKLTYLDGSNAKSRVVTKTIAFAVSDCLRWTASPRTAEVVGLQNTLVDGQSVFVTPFPGQPIEIPAHQTAYVLTNGQSVDWLIDTPQEDGHRFIRSGVIRL